MLVRKVTLAIGMLLSSPALSQGTRPVTIAAELPGWKCMLPAAVFGPNGINAPPLPVYENTALGSREVGLSGGTIIVPEQARPTNGRIPMIRIDGSRAWIQADLLVPWRSLNNPKAACRPVVLSNGRYGTTTSG